MPFTTAALNKALDGMAAATSIIAFASLHSAYDVAGGNELSGGSYARQAVTFAAASSGSKVTTGSPAAVFPTPAVSTVAFVGLWSLATAGSFAGMGANGGNSQFAFTAPVATPGVFTAPGSAYSNGDQVVLFGGVGTTQPGGFTYGNLYFVVNASGATFQLSATSGGSAINVTTTAGSGLVQKIVVETFNAAGTFNLSSDTLTIV